MPEFAVILPDIRSIHNVGSVFRTADAAGFRKIYLCGITPEPLDRFGKVRRDFAKVSLGAENSVAWEYKLRAPGLIKKLKKEGWKILALEQAPDSKSLYSFKPGKASKMALIVGNEVSGVPPSILKLADGIVEIPMRGKKESLNVGVAFGIAAYHLIFSTSQAKLKP